MFKARYFTARYFQSLYVGGGGGAIGVPVAMVWRTYRYCWRNKKRIRQVPA